LIALTGVLALAMKNWRTGTDVPASVPLVQAGPVESRRSAGTKTWYRPDESAYRNGSS